MIVIKIKGWIRITDITCVFTNHMSMKTQTGHTTLRIQLMIFEEFDSLIVGGGILIH